jgi:hypothetical protein
MEAKQAAETEPTYPNPKMLTDKPKRILPAIEYLGYSVHYELYQHQPTSEAIASGSPSGRWTDSSTDSNQLVFNLLRNIPKISPESSPEVGAKGGQLFPPDGTAMGQIPRKRNGSAAG